MADFMSECDLYLNQKMSHFAKIAGFNKLDKSGFAHILVDRNCFNGSKI